jgi:hypothetical protein
MKKWAIGSQNDYIHDGMCKGSEDTAFRALTGCTVVDIAAECAIAR